MAKTLFLESREAAKILGLSVEMFLVLASEEDWLRPILLGARGKKRTKRWHIDDIKAFQRVLIGRSVGEDKTGGDED